MSTSILIAGGGVVGCMSAFVLRQRGFDVTIVDRGQLGGESTWAGGGILFPLLPWKYKTEVNRLAMAGARLYPAVSEQLHAETGINPEYQQSGMLVLPEYDLDKALSWCKENQLLAQLQATDYSEKLALWLPQVGQIRPPRLIKALRKWLEMHDVNIYENTELLPLQSNGSIDGWQSSDGRVFHADTFVLSSGAWSSVLLGTQNEIEIKPIRGQMLLYSQQDVTLNHLIYQEGFYLIPRRDGLILAGSTLEDTGFDKSTTESALEELSIKAGSILPALQDAPVIKQWSGLRPGSPDNIPSIKQHSAISNLFINTGHFRYGATMAPASANMLADLVEQSF